MAVIDQFMCADYAAYNGDCCEVMPSLPSESIDMSIYSPPFGGLYNYSSSERDLSNSRSYAEFFEHYEFVVKKIARLTKRGRFTAVHCMDVPKEGCNIGGYIDFPGDIIRLHEKHGLEFWTRRCIWKDPLVVRNRTMSKGLAHKQIVMDSSLTTIASADYLLEFRKKGDNAVPVTHEHGLMRYAGSRPMPASALKYRGWTGSQLENKFSHWIWRAYASCNWDDIRLDQVLDSKEARDPEDERHCHPLQLDVIERCVELRSNPGEVVLTPFMGVGSEVYGAVFNGRRGIGVELKSTYYRQALKYLANAKEDAEGSRDQIALPFDDGGMMDDAE
jgi:DNA modification methylase